MEEYAPGLDGEPATPTLAADEVKLETLGLDLHGPWVRLRLLAARETLVDVAGFLSVEREAGAYLSLAHTGAAHLVFGVSDATRVVVDLDRHGEAVFLTVRPPPHAFTDTLDRLALTEEDEERIAAWRHGDPGNVAWSGLKLPHHAPRVLLDQPPWHVTLPYARFMRALREHVAHYGTAGKRWVEILDRAGPP